MTVTTQMLNSYLGDFGGIDRDGPSRLRSPTSEPGLAGVVNCDVGSGYCPC